jgi:predicted DCC family thiol-disulfide oxidoreductase YuxK
VTSKTTDPPRAIVIYDDDCGFCRWTLAVLLTLDRPRFDRSGGERGPGALHPLLLGTAEADRLLADLSVEQRNASWHLVDPTGARFSAGAALAPAVALLPAGRRPAAVLARIPGPTERAYRWVADHRGLLGRFVPGRARRWSDRVIAAHGGPARPH